MSDASQGAAFKRGAITGPSCPRCGADPKWSRFAGKNRQQDLSLRQWFCFLCKHEWCGEGRVGGTVDKPARKIPTVA